MGILQKLYGDLKRILQGFNDYFTASSAAKHHLSDLFALKILNNFDF